MSESFYQSFIDGLVTISDSVAANRVKIGFRHPEPSPEQREVEELVFSLTEEQKAVLARMLQEEKTSGIHDALAHLEEREYTVSDSSGQSFTGSPYCDLHFDYVARLAGDEWPR